MVAGRSSQHHIRDKTECVFGRVLIWLGVTSVMGSLTGLVHG